MRFLKRYSVVILCAFVFLALVWARLDGAYTKSLTHTVLPSPKHQDNRPAGEIVAGFYLEQPINWNSLRRLSKQDALGEVCVNVLLANYSNRANSGNFALTLLTEGGAYRTVVSANTVRDNAYHRFCYDSVVLGDIAHKPAALVLEGVSSPSGAAITAWMTRDTAHGEARKHGAGFDRSLIFWIETTRESSDKRMIAIILTLLCGLSGALLFWPRNKQ
jgi:hypothetical protein